MTLQIWDLLSEQQRTGTQPTTGGRADTCTAQYPLPAQSKHKQYVFTVLSNFMRFKILFEEL